MYYLDNKDGSYTYYVKCSDGGMQAVVVWDKNKIPAGYKEGTFTVQEKL